MPIIACVCTRKLASLLAWLCAQHAYQQSIKFLPMLALKKCAFAVLICTPLAAPGGGRAGAQQCARLALAHSEVDALQYLLARGRHRRAQALHLQQHRARRTPQAAAPPRRQTPASVPAARARWQADSGASGVRQGCRVCLTSLGRGFCTATPCLPAACVAAARQRPRRPSCKDKRKGRRFVLCPKTSAVLTTAFAVLQKLF